MRELFPFAAVAFILLVFARVDAYAQSPAPEKLNFKRALQLALEKNPDYDTLVRTERNQTLERKNAWSSLLPSVDLTANHAYTRYSREGLASGSNRTLGLGIHEPWTNSLGLSITENLYDNGETWRNAKIANLNADISKLNLQQGKNKTLVDVAKAYFDYSEAFFTLSLQKEQQTTLRTQFKSIETRYFQGLSSNRDYLRIKTDLQRSEVQILNSEFRVREVKENLIATIGVSGEYEFEPYDPKGIRVELLSAPRIDPEQTFEFRVARAQEEIADIQYTSAQRAYWPRLSLRGSYEYTQPQYIGERFEYVDDPFWNLSGLIVLEYNLWDWGIRRRNVEIAANARAIEINGRERQRIQTRQSLSILTQNNRVIVSSLKVSAQILRASEDVYTSLNRGYREGKVIYTDLISALGNFYDSRTQDITLRFSLLKNRADLAYYEGNADEVLNQQ